MANGTLKADTPAGGTVARRRGLSVRSALAVAVLGIAGAIGATRLVLRNEYRVGVEALFVVFALIAFGVAAYGLIQAVLALVDSAGDRRRQERAVTERRKGDRARKPAG
jgi:hypothetical protein